MLMNADQRLPDEPKINSSLPDSERPYGLSAADDEVVSQLSAEEEQLDTSDDEYAASGSKQRKARQRTEQRPLKRPRLLNERTSTLRGAHEAPGATYDGTINPPCDSDEDSCMQGEVGAEQGQDAVLERVISEEQAQADLQAIRGMWELAAVYEFMVQFKYWLNFSQLYPVHDLEEAIVTSTGPGLLAQLHIDLLKGIATRSQVGPDNWTSTLAARLSSEAHAMQQPMYKLPFRPVRGREAAEYAQLGAAQRVLTLKALADMRADREDLRILVEDIMKGAGPAAADAAAKKTSGSSTPPRRGAKGSSAPPPPPPLTAEDMRGRTHLGCDATGCRYYWFDMLYDHDAPVGLMGSRLYIEHPPRQPTAEELQQQQQLEQQQKLLYQQQLQEQLERQLRRNRQAAYVQRQLQVLQGVQLPALQSGSAAADAAIKPQPPRAGATDKPDDSEIQQWQQQRQQQQPATGGTDGQQNRLEDPADGWRQRGNGQQQHSQDGPNTAGLHQEAGQQQQQQEQEQVQGGDDNQVQQQQQHAAIQQTQQQNGESKGKENEQVAVAVPKPNPDGDAGIKANAGPLASVTANSDNKRADGSAPADAAADGLSAAADASVAQANTATGNIKQPADDASAACNGTANSKVAKAAASRRNAPAAAATNGFGRPARKAAAAAAAKCTQQLSRKHAEAVADSHTSQVPSGKTGKGERARAAADCSRASSATLDDLPPAGADGAADSKQQERASQEQEDATVAAAMEAAYARSRPSRRAAAEAAARIAAQSANPSVQKLAEEAAAAAEKAAAGSSKAGSGCRKRRSAGNDVAVTKEPYVLQPDAVSGKWHLAADSLEGLEQLSQQLQERSDAADVALGELLAGQVVTTLLQRKEREEKYARARSRVAKALGLDQAAGEAGGRSVRQRRAVTYNFEDYDKHMKSAIRAHERGEAEEQGAAARLPYAAPPYDVDVRRGRSGGPAEPVMQLEEIELLRKKKMEQTKLGLQPANDSTDHQSAAASQGDAATGQQLGQHHGVDNPQQLQLQQQPEVAVVPSTASGGSTQQASAAGGTQQGTQPLDLQLQVVQQQQEPRQYSGRGRPPTGSRPPKQPRKSSQGGAKPQPALQPMQPVAASTVPADAAEAANQQVAAAAAAAAAAGSVGGAARPRRKAAAGVAAAVAAAAAAAGGREDQFVSIGSQMQEEWQNRKAFDFRWQQEAQPRAAAAEAEAYVQGEAYQYGLAGHGHHHSSRAQSMTHMAEQQGYANWSEMANIMQQQQDMVGTWDYAGAVAEAAAVGAMAAAAAMQALAEAPQKDLHGQHDEHREQANGAAGYDAASGFQAADQAYEVAANAENTAAYHAVYLNLAQAAGTADDPAGMDSAAAAPTNDAVASAAFKASALAASLPVPSGFAHAQSTAMNADPASAYYTEGANGLWQQSQQAQQWQMPPHVEHQSQAAWPANTVLQQQAQHEQPPGWSAMQGGTDQLHMRAAAQLPVAQQLQ